MKKPKVGQIVFDGTKELKVKKVGRKYFYVGLPNYPEYMDCKYYINTWRECVEFGTARRLYESKASHQDELSRHLIASKITKIFRHEQPGEVTIEDLWKVWAILEPYCKES